MSEPNRLPHRAPLSGIVIGLVLALALTAVFAIHERNTARQLGAQNDDVTAALKTTQGQVQALTDKINNLTLPPPAPAAAPVIAAKPAASRHPNGHRRPKDDPRWKKVQSQLDEQNRQIEATRQDLNSARTDLSGSIARTHEELVVLEKKGERNYYEFDLDKSKHFQAEGPVGIRLKKANTKRQYADLELMVDDVNLAQKHVNLLQPVVFYAAEGGQPVEIVINRISGNHIHGYVSAPKYKRSELTAMSSSSSTGSMDSNQPATPQNPQNKVANRQKLSLPH